VSLTSSAIVLRAINYGEADRIVTLLGRETGRLSALARGARKSQRRFPGGLGLCTVGIASLRERPGAELLTLEGFEITRNHASLGTDVACMAHGAYAAEVVSKLCAPRQVEAAVYDQLITFLDLLDREGASAERLRVLELGLLTALGFGPVLDTCAACGGERFLGRPSAEVSFRWDPDRGGAVCVACARAGGGRPMAPGVRETLLRLSATSLAAAAQAPLAPDLNRACREALLEIVTHHITGPLKSVEFIAKLSGSHS
jgi:DNA repair protein RecO (recombination protein O)